MLTLTSRELCKKLPLWLKGRMTVLLLGPPGTGKTFTARKISIECFGQELVEVLNGGDEASWKSLFPYKTPAGSLELGIALRASGYKIQEGWPIKTSDGGALVVDEFNRVPPELKSAFQLLASERVVPNPLGGQLPVDCAIVATGNDKDLGVDEAARAELDRYDLAVRLNPTPEEMARITSGEGGVRLEVAQVITEAAMELAGKLDPKKFHQPEGLRLMISIAKILKTATLDAVDSFRGAAERCFPVGRRGAERHRAEFDQAVGEVAAHFADLLEAAGELTDQPPQPAVPVATSQASGGIGEATSLHALFTAMRKDAAQKVSSKELPLPRPFHAMMNVFIKAFGMGVVKRLTVASKRQNLSQDPNLFVGSLTVVANRKGPHSVSFHNAERHRVELFCRLCAKL